MFKTFFLIFTLLSPLSFAASELIVWNVGQGQWVTQVHKEFCVHYDMGGEINVTKRVLQRCQGKKNLVHLSHWDWDHISFVASFARKSFFTCLIARPLGSASAYKEKLLAKLALCQPEELRPVYRTLFHGQIRSRKRSNDGSSVVQVKDFNVLIPGDSTTAMEKKWRWHTSSSTQGLILGHHGSRTSTSKALLARLPRLRWAVASARQKRYGHPHAQVRRLLRQNGVALIRTEDWGHLHFVKRADQTLAHP